MTLYKSARLGQTDKLGLTVVLRECPPNSFLKKIFYFMDYIIFSDTTFAHRTVFPQTRQAYLIAYHHSGGGKHLVDATEPIEREPLPLPDYSRYRDAGWMYKNDAYALKFKLKLGGSRRKTIFMDYSANHRIFTVLIVTIPLIVTVFWGFFL